MRSAAIAVDPLAHGLPCSHICGAATMICCLRRSTLRLTRRYILLAARNTDTARPMHVCCLRSAPPHICSDAASVHSRHSGNSRARAMRWIHSADLPSSDRERRNALLAVIPRSARSTRTRTPQSTRAATYAADPASRRPAARGDRGCRKSRGSTSARSAATPRRASRAASAWKADPCSWIFFTPSHSGAAANRTGADPRKSWIGGPALA